MEMDKMTMEELRFKILEASDPDYQKFASGLLPGTENIAGVRLPVLRKLAKKTAREQGLKYLEEAFGGRADHELFEEIMLQGMVIGYGSFSLEKRLALIEQFVPKITNWSVCDSFCSGLKFTREHREDVWNFLQKFIHSDGEYAVRFAVVMFINYFIDSEYVDKVLAELEGVRHPGYYAKMAAAWAFSMCYVFDKDKTMDCLNAGNTDEFVYDKALQKILESRQVPAGEKEGIRALRKTT